MHPFKTCVRCAYMAIKVSSYEEPLANRNTPNQVLQAFPELQLGALTVAYLRGIGADNIENEVPNDQLDQDNPITLPLDVYHSILEALVDQDTHSVSVRSGPRVPQLETGLLYLLRSHPLRRSS